MTLDVLGCGEVLGEVSVLDQCGHSADVWTLEECVLQCIDGEEFLRCLTVMPALSNNLLRIEIERL